MGPDYGWQWVKVKYEVCVTVECSWKEMNLAGKEERLRFCRNLGKWQLKFGEGYWQWKCRKKGKFESHSGGGGNLLNWITISIIVSCGRAKIKIFLRNSIEMWLISHFGESSWINFRYGEFESWRRIAKWDRFFFRLVADWKVGGMCATNPAVLKEVRAGPGK